MLHILTVKKESPSSAIMLRPRPAPIRPLITAALMLPPARRQLLKRNLHLLSVMCPAQLSTNALQLSYPPHMFQNQPDGRRFIPTRGSRPIHAAILVSEEPPPPPPTSASAPDVLRVIYFLRVLNRLPHSHRNLDRACDNGCTGTGTGPPPDISIHRRPLGRLPRSHCNLSRDVRARPPVRSEDGSRSHRRHPRRGDPNPQETL